MNDRCFIIAGDYINAISIWKSLKILKVKDSIFILNLSGRNMAGRIFSECQVINGIVNANSLFDFLKSLEKESTKFLFLTSEIFHKSLWINKKLLSELNVVVKMGNLDPEIILNKNTFLKTIQDRTNIPVPLSYCVSKLQEINKPVFVKLKSSFILDKHVPKGKCIYQSKELEKYLIQLNNIGFQQEDIEIQELLSTVTDDNISICGWYEKDICSLHQTRKILQHPPKIGNGDVIEYMELNKKLVDYAIQILKLFDYYGPFEIEFIKERNGENFKVIEMNPRFWMQHGLIEQITGHFLVAKYIGSAPAISKLKYKYWLYPVISLIQIAKGKLGYVPFFFRKDVYKPISVRQSIRFLLSYLLSH